MGRPLFPVSETKELHLMGVPFWALLAIVGLAAVFFVGHLLFAGSYLS
jgi:hypothetical protein